MEGAFDLNLRHLRMLSIIAENGSLSAAAKAASISQPALTQALAKLEVAFGAVLFDRTAAGVIPTGSGRRVLQRVERALKSFALACRRCARNAPAAQFENYLTSAHVRGLMTLAESGSFLRAADAAGVSVPSLHRAVRDLEKLSGTALVERRGRGVGMTRAGAKLARGFTIAVTELGAAIEETTDGGGRLSIGAMALSRSQLLPATLAELLRERPHVRIDVIEGSYLELVDLLRSGKIDILIGALRDAPGRDLFQEPLFTDRLTVIGRAEHPLAGKFASFDQLGENSWIVARRASGLLDRWQEIFDRSGKPRPEAPIQCGSVALIRGLLLRTDFLTLLSTDQVRSEIEAGTLVRIESDVPDTMRTIGAITRRDWFPTKLQDAFMVALRRTGREAMPG